MRADGSGKTATQIRDIQRQLRRQKICRSASVKVSETTNGTMLEVIRSAAGGASVNAALFQIASISTATLSCNQVNDDGSISATSTTVNIPPTLQHGASYNTTEVVSGTTFTIPLEIVPAYAVGDIISAVEINGEWYDLNYDGRQYLEAHQTFQVCVNGATKLARIRGSIPA